MVWSLIAIMTLGTPDMVLGMDAAVFIKQRRCAEFAELGTEGSLSDIGTCAMTGRADAMSWPNSVWGNVAIMSSATPDMVLGISAEPLRF